MSSVRGRAAFGIRGRARRRPPFAHRAALAGILLAAVTAGPRAAGVRQDAAWTYPLQAIEATGQKRLTQAQVAALSGLRPGAVVLARDVEAARQRLVDSGFFTSVGYRFRNAGYSIVVIFTVAEVAWQTPVVFDNFVDHTDAQATAAVARDVPSFDGVAPDREAVLKRIAAALERLARESKDLGPVTFTLVYDKAQRTSHWRFRLDRASGPVPICTVSLSGVPPALVTAAAERIAPLVGTDYSRDFVLGHARESVLSGLAANGLPRASVAGVVVRREAARPDCPRGVGVTVAIDPGGPPLFRSAVQH